MNIYKGIEYIKNFFSKTNSIKKPNPFEKEDIELLVDMRMEARFLTASNGCRYFYYVLSNEKNIDVAKFVMKRNGLNPSVHKTYYYAWKPKILRIPAEKIEESKENKEFLEKVSYGKKSEELNIDLRVENIRKQMKQR